ncbi:hypothetical protein [Thiobacter aerophilum]|uniref:OmpA family protein n=1 Tax=Thiobacter aerophilum TaxID=3121275 RepID=A0ABV0EBN1_9BURK
MRWILGLFVLLPWAAAGQDFTVPESFWLAPRSGPAIIAEPAIAQAVHRFLDHPGAQLILHHGRNDEASAQAEELRGWLIALGIEADVIQLLADGSSGRPLRIEVTSSNPAKAPQ